MVIAIDFDGTCVKHKFPEIGEDIGAVPVLRKLIAKGHQLILYTMRSNNEDLFLSTTDGIENVTGDFLDYARSWFHLHDIPLYGIQENPTQKGWTKSPKCYAELYIDDAALGIPLCTAPGERPWVDWKEVELLLKAKGIID